MPTPLWLSSGSTGSSPGNLPAEAFTAVTCTDDRGRAREYDLASTTVELGIKRLLHARLRGDWARMGRGTS